MTTVSVVFATHNRAERLRALLASLCEQAFRDFEVVVVDDGSTDATPAVLAAAAADLPLHVIRHERPTGPAVARNAGWRAARGELVAFTDDDCRARPSWLEAGVAAWGGHPDRIVQGRTDPDPAEADRAGPFTRTLRIGSLGPNYQTCNVFYPRALLERHGGFFEGFARPSVEDADLAWRCLQAGAGSVFAPEAAVVHAVHELGPAGLLRLAWRWHDMPLLVRRHPGYRAHFTYRVFWKGGHYLLARAALGLLLPRGLRPLRFWCLAPLVPSYLERARQEGGPPWQAPYWVLHDAVEVATMVRGSLRHRTLVL